ncbi:MAG: nucleotidyltransferase domain-containing protein [Muribaculaceae bacterium]|nr:nucleotidyltransferase domain-containing protein [Muribaculaceae bacterium]
MKIAVDIKEKIKRCLQRVAPDASILLYGSQARGDARADSDIDLLILLPDSLSPAEFVRRKLDISGHIYDLSLELGKEISPLILVPKVFYARRTPFTENVLLDGIAI